MCFRTALLIKLAFNENDWIPCILDFALIRSRGVDSYSGDSGGGGDHGSVAGEAGKSPEAV